MTILYSFLFYNLMETRIYVFVGKKKKKKKKKIIQF